jgi:hypothetical protein
MDPALFTVNQIHRTFVRKYDEHVRTSVWRYNQVLSFADNGRVVVKGASENEHQLFRSPNQECRASETSEIGSHWRRSVGFRDNQKICGRHELVRSVHDNYAFDEWGNQALKHEHQQNKVVSIIM